MLRKRGFRENVYAVALHIILLIQLIRLCRLSLYNSNTATQESMQQPAQYRHIKK